MLTSWVRFSPSRLRHDFFGYKHIVIDIIATDVARDTVMDIATDVTTVIATDVAIDIAWYDAPIKAGISTLKNRRELLSCKRFDNIVSNDRHVGYYNWQARRAEVLIELRDS